MWQRHSPDAPDQEGAKFPAGTTRDQADAIVREIAARERVVAPRGPVAAEIRDRLHSGEVTLTESRKRHTNLYARVGDARYQVRIVGVESTAHPIDGRGVVRHKHNKVTGRMEQVEMPLGRRPVEGWDRPRSR